MSYVIKSMRRMMGTLVTITIIHMDKEEAGKAMLAAFKAMEKVNNLMSVHDESSEVSLLNRNGFYEGLSADTRYVVERADHFSQLTGGIFDVTVLPLLRLQEKHYGDSATPADWEVAKSRRLINYTNIVIEGKNIRFRKIGMGITLAGIAKGYAVDRAIAALREFRIKHALVNAGGDIRAIGGKTDAIPWQVALRDPRNRSRVAAKFEIRDRAIATSGTYRRAINDIVNPEGGHLTNGIASSTVIADTAIDADILATAVFILGAEKGKNLLKKVEGASASVITSDGSFINLA